MNPGALLQNFDQIAEAPDAVSRLRRFILDLAVRGKLVPQDPGDEPASELLTQIEREKARRVKAGELRKGKPLPCMSEDARPFSLPRNWIWSRLAEVGFVNPRNNADDGLQASFVPMPLISADYGIPNKHEVRPWLEIKNGYTHFAEGDVALAKITPCFENGKSTVFRNLTGGIGAGTTELHVLRPVTVNPDYVLIFLKSPHFIETGIPRMTGTAGQKRVSTEYFSLSPFSLPPLAEQHRIVAKVDELMALCDELEGAQRKRERRRDRLVAATLHGLNDGAAISVSDEMGNGAGDVGIPAADVRSTFENNARFFFNHLPRLTTRPEHIKQLRQTILNLAVRGQLVPQDPNDEPASVLLKRMEVARKKLIKAGEIRKIGNLQQIGDADIPFGLPSSWEWVRLGAIGDWGSGSTPPRSNSEYYNGGIPWLKSGELEDKSDLKGSEETVSEMAISKCSFRKNKPGDVLIAMYGATIGKLAILGEFAVTNQAVCSCTPFKGVYNRYLFLYLLSRRADFHAQSEGGAQPNISKIKIINSPFPLPPLAEQHRIVTRVDELMALCYALESRLNTTAIAREQFLENIIRCVQTTQ